jgi:uncharacterized peroxidase-related enzyme
MSAWIEMVPVDAAEGPLVEMYELVRTPHGTVDNVMRAHSLRPHTMAGHVALYRSVLHHEGNMLPLWFLEAVASYTSSLNRCAYSYSHHAANMKRLIGGSARAAAVEAALQADRPEDAFAGKELALLRYTRRLTTDVAGIDRATFEACVAAGASHGEILEVNQVCGYFNYSNRLLNGLGVTTEGDTIGYYDEATAAD